MHRSRSALRRKESERRHRDVVREALRLRGVSAEESLKALSKHNEALLKMNKARR